MEIPNTIKVFRSSLFVTSSVLSIPILSTGGARCKYAHFLFCVLTIVITFFMSVEIETKKISNDQQELIQSDPISSVKTKSLMNSIVSVPEHCLLKYFLHNVQNTADKRCTK